MIRVTWPVFLAILISCSHKSPQERFVNYLNDPKHKITQIITVGNVTAKLKWMPPEYEKMIDSSNGESDNYYFFEARFDQTNDAKLNKEKVMYLDFDMQKDFSMVLGKDSILPAISQRIQNGHDRSYEYLLAFEKRSANENFTIIYNDQIFGIGKIAFAFKQEDIKKIPTLAAK